MPREKDRAIAATDEAYRLAAALEARISEYQPGSEISCLNRNAGKTPCHLSPDTREMLEMALRIGDLTEHAFDIRFASPSPEGRRGEIKIDPIQNLGILTHSQTKLGVSSIAKGFIVDKMVAYLQQQGFQRVLVDAGGDLMARGGPWEVAIQIPEKPPGEFVHRQTLSDLAMGSSGLYEQGRHIFDPRTGEKLNRRGGVTVLAGNLTLAGALGTGFFVLGEKESAVILKKIPHLQVIWTDPDGSFREYTSRP